VGNRKDGITKVTRILTKKRGKVKEKGFAGVNRKFFTQPERLRYITENSKKNDYGVLFTD
jgi:hypothetical protein